MATNRQHGFVNATVWNVDTAVAEGMLALLKLGKRQPLRAGFDFAYTAANFRVRHTPGSERKFAWPGIKSNRTWYQAASIR
jgi:hypothetical protein